MEVVAYSVFVATRLNLIADALADPTSKALASEVKVSPFGFTLWA